jgi:hypothetical protein
MFSFNILNLLPNHWLNINFLSKGSLFSQDQHPIGFHLQMDENLCSLGLLDGGTI